MALTHSHLHNETIKATAVVAAKRFVLSAGTHCGAGAKAVGISVVEAAAAGDYFSVCTNGVAVLEAGATVTPDQEIESDANGKGIPLASGISNGIALDGASSGEFFRIVLR